VKVDPGTGAKRQVRDRVDMILPPGTLIAMAYGLPPESGARIVGGPDWLRQDVDQYEIHAKIDDAMVAAMEKMTPEQQREQVALMEQAMLADRFKLKVHFETREMPVYALVVAKGGPKLVVANGDENRLAMVSRESGQELTATGVTMEQFAQSPLLKAQPVGGHPVVNQTSLKGRYDFTLRWSKDGAESEEPALLTAIQEQLGLRLVPAKAPVEVIVIDHVEKPSEN
jgi:bla regulator protein blaR1